MLCYGIPCYAMLCYAMLCYAMPCHAMLTRSSYLLTGFLSFSKLFALPVPLLRQVLKVVLSPARELHFQEIKCSCFCWSRIVFWVPLGCLWGGFWDPRGILLGPSGYPFRSLGFLWVSFSVFGASLGVLLVPQGRFGCLLVPIPGRISD